MLTKDKILELLQSEYPVLAARFGVKRIGLFGSFATGHPDDTSDIDLVVDFDRPIGFQFMGLAEYLENVFGRKVDLLTEAGIQGIRIKPIAKNIADNTIYVQANR